MAGRSPINEDPGCDRATSRLSRMKAYPVKRSVKFGVVAEHRVEFCLSRMVIFRHVDQNRLGFPGRTNLAILPAPTTKSDR